VPERSPLKRRDEVAVGAGAICTHYLQAQVAKMGGECRIQ
jgi:hypothetical protein